MTGLRVAFVCQWFQPEPVSQPSWIVDALRRLGAEVEVLTGVPNYPSGRVLPGYRAWRTSSEVRDGVPVNRAPLYPSHDASTGRRVLNYLSWAISSAIFGQRHLRKADVALVYSSPATAALAAMVSRVRHRVPYVLLIQDVWPDSIFSSGFLNGVGGRFAEWLVGLFVDVAYRQAAHIAVISPGMVDLLVSRGVPQDKISVVYNWVADERVDIEPRLDLREELGLREDDFVVMYAGNHGAAQALESVLAAFGEIPDSEPCHLVLVGDGVEKQNLRELAATFSPERVHFLDPRPREQMPALMSQADAQLVSLADRPLFAVTMPSKLQSVMAAGHPVLVCAPGDAAAVVDRVGAGISVAPEDAAALASAVTRMRHQPAAARKEMGERGRSFYTSHMSEAVGANSLLRLLEAAAGANTADVGEMSLHREGNSRQ